METQPGGVSAKAPVPFRVNVSEANVKDDSPAEAKPSHLKTLLRVAVLSIATLLASAAFAADTATHKVVNGVAIYLGVLPAEMILGHPKPHTEAQMHGGVPPGKHQYHVLVSLFDAASGKRIGGAKVSVRVYEINLAGTQKKLEPMLVAGTITYGNYFNIPAANNPYRIRVLIELPGVADVIETEFEYQHAQA